MKKTIITILAAAVAILSFSDNANAQCLSGQKAIRHGGIGGGPRRSGDMMHEMNTQSVSTFDLIADDKSYARKEENK